jgi:hypothetical protein
MRHGWSLDGITIHEPSSDASRLHPSEVEVGDTMNTVLATLQRARPRRRRGRDELERMLIWRAEDGPVTAGPSPAP